jgi:hypothetical protein
MGTSLKERVAKARSKGAEVDTKAPEPEATEASDTQALEPGDTATESEATNVVDLGEKVIEGLSEAEAAAIVEAHSGDIELGAALLEATRTTKANQTEYNGVTPEGYIVRVWAPAGLPMLARAVLEQD